jgi:hypothetical protein
MTPEAKPYIKFVVSYPLTPLIHAITSTFTPALWCVDRSSSVLHRPAREILHPGAAPVPVPVPVGGKGELPAPGPLSSCGDRRRGDSEAEGGRGVWRRLDARIAGGLEALEDLVACGLHIPHLLAQQRRRQEAQPAVGRHDEPVRVNVGERELEPLPDLRAALELRGVDPDAAEDDGLLLEERQQGGEVVLAVGVLERDPVVPVYIWGLQGGYIWVYMGVAGRLDMHMWGCRGAYNSPREGLMDPVVPVGGVEGGRQTDIALLGRVRVLRGSIRGGGIRGESIRGGGIRGESIRGESIRGESIRGGSVRCGRHSKGHS